MFSIKEILEQTSIQNEKKRKTSEFIISDRMTVSTNSFHLRVIPPMETPLENNPLDNLDILLKKQKLGKLVCKKSSIFLIFVILKSVRYFQR